MDMTKEIDIFDRVNSKVYENCIGILVGDNKSELEDAANQIVAEIFFEETGC